MSDHPIVIRVGDAKEGKYHRGTISHDRLLTDEACNLDDAASRSYSTVIPDGTPAAMLCERCFPVEPIAEPEPVADGPEWAGREI